MNALTERLTALYGLLKKVATGLALYALFQIVFGPLVWAFITIPVLRFVAAHWPR